MSEQCQHNAGHAHPCGKPTKRLEAFDDHDSNAGMYFVEDFCSFDCFLSELRHAADDAASDGGLRLKRVLGMIQS